MYLERLCLKNFRCFGPGGTTVQFERCSTVLIGTNGSGKSAVFQALNRLFGIGRSSRAIVARDFHVDASGVRATSLEIEAWLKFPELENEDHDTDAVPGLFKHLTVPGCNEPLFCRLCLRATWTDDGTAEGAIEEDVRWVRTGAEPSSEEWESCPRVSTAERSAIHVLLVPAQRDAAQMFSSILRGRIGRTASWSKNFRDKALQMATELDETFHKEKPAELIEETLRQRWQALHRADTEQNPKLRLVPPDLERLVRQAQLVFAPDEAGGERTLEELSDGQQALLHIALIGTVLDIEDDLRKTQEGFVQDDIVLPYLTLLVIEEPENNLAPFFLARIVDLARDIGKKPTAQVLLSTHSASMLGRIEPDEIRYLRLDEARRTSFVRKLQLPAKPPDAGKYVRLAVRAYPELYFARFVILVEGDSEQIVIPRLAQAMGIPLDPSFVPVVPLGGRHVEHFWRLLDDLAIPNATLLDLDFGRPHGGASHVNSIIEKLQQRCTKNESTSLPEHVLCSNGSFRDMLCVLHELERHGIFFSRPLDLDLAMLRCFREAYRSTKAGTPSRKSQDPRTSVLGENDDANHYPASFNDDFAWYRYLFLSGSKPDTHLAALARVERTDLATKAPAVLKRLVRHVAGRIGILPGK